MYQKNYHVKLIGRSPLIMHADNINWADAIEAERTAIKEKDRKQFRAGDDRVPAHTWKGCVYNDGKMVTLPHQCLMVCLRVAGARFTLKGRTTYKSLTQSSIMFMDPHLAFFQRGQAIQMDEITAIKGSYADQVKAVELLGFELMAKRASVQRKKHVRCRPVFDEWSAEGECVVDDEQLTPKMLAKIMTEAGLYVGLCDWRPGAPASPGPYGRFAAELTEL